VNAENSSSRYVQKPINIVGENDYIHTFFKYKDLTRSKFEIMTKIKYTEIKVIVNFPFLNRLQTVSVFNFIFTACIQSMICLDT